MTPAPQATVFTHVRLFDGSGSAPFAGELRVDGHRITAIARDGAGFRRVMRAGLVGGAVIAATALVKQKAWRFQWPQGSSSPPHCATSSKKCSATSACPRPGMAACRPGPSGGCCCSTPA
mgnify:CR=1 FL=1